MALRMVYDGLQTVADSTVLAAIISMENPVTKERIT